ncbi:MAG TPA: DUF5662 family protein [Lachnospiraceae bacterium]
MKAWSHFKTITKHKLTVMKYCFRMGLIKQGICHDLSKYSWIEFSVGAKYYQGDRSPNNAEREDKGRSDAWLHHKGRNKHHFEYWIDYCQNPQSEKILEGIEMPRCYVAEMIADRISACKVYMGENYHDAAAYEYYKKGTDKLWFIHPKTQRQLKGLLKMLAKEGEDTTIWYIKNVFLKRKDSHL